MLGGYRQQCRKRLGRLGKWVVLNVESPKGFV